MKCFVTAITHVRRRGTFYPKAVLLVLFTWHSNEKTASSACANISYKLHTDSEIYKITLKQAVTLQKIVHDKRTALINSPDRSFDDLRLVIEYFKSPRWIVNKTDKALLSLLLWWPVWALFNVDDYLSTMLI